MDARKGLRRRWHALGLLSVGLVLGVSLTAGPASSHVGGTVAHLWGHLKPKADARYYTKANANARYYTRAQADERYAPAGAVASARLAFAGISTGTTVLDTQGHRVYGTCGLDGGSIVYRNRTGASVRLLRAGAGVTVADQADHTVDTGTVATPREAIFQVAWGADLASLTTFTAHWRASASSCEILIQAVTSG